MKNYLILFISFYGRAKILNFSKKEEYLTGRLQIEDYKITYGNNNKIIIPLRLKSLALYYTLPNPSLYFLFNHKIEICLKGYSLVKIKKGQLAKVIIIGPVTLDGLNKSTSVLILFGIGII